MHVYLLLAETRERAHVHLIATHAVVDVAIMEINVSILMHVHLLHAKTRERALEALTATRAGVHQATLEQTVNLQEDGCVYMSVMAVVYLMKIGSLQVIVILT